MERVKTADVLIVEDSEEVIWTMGNVLENAGFTVDAVMTGKDALERLSSSPETKLVILNYLLPDMSGLTVLNRIKKNGSSFQVIAISAMKEVKERLVEAGAFAFLEKPFDIEELVSLCRKAVGSEQCLVGSRH